MSIPMLLPAFATFPPRLSRADPSRTDFPRANPARAETAGPAVTILRTLDAVDAIAAEWQALDATAPDATGFQSFAWCRAWIAAHDAHAHEWRVLAIREDGRLVAVWPLQRRTVLGARVLEWLGDPWTQYGDALAAPGPRRLAHLATGWREIAAWTDIDVIRLRRVRADAALMALPGFTGRTVVNSETAPCVDLRRPPARKPDKSLRARRRKLEAIGPVAFDIVTDAAERRGAIAQTLARKRAWARERGLASSGLWHAAIDATLHAMADSEALVIGRLSVGGEIAALELGLRTSAGYRSLIGCHDPAHASASPGHLLIGDMIAWCRAQGLATYDLMIPADAYKRRWANEETAVNDHLLRRRARGWPALLWFRSRPRIKAAYAALPEQIRAALAAWKVQR